MKTRTGVRTSSGGHSTKVVAKTATPAMQYLIALVLLGVVLEAAYQFDQRSAWVLMIIIVVGIAARYGDFFKELNWLITGASRVTKG